MQTSAKELLLLLKKWESKSKRVAAAGIVQPKDGFRCVFRVTGGLQVDESASTFSVGDVSGDYALCQISDLEVGYSVGHDLDWSEFFDTVIEPEAIEEVVFMRNPDLSTLALYIFKST